MLVKFNYQKNYMNIYKYVKLMHVFIKIIHLAKGLGRKYCHRILNLANKPHSRTLSLKFWKFIFRHR